MFYQCERVCELTAAITTASITHTSRLRTIGEPEDNTLTVSFAANVDIPALTPITITNLTGTKTDSGMIPLEGSEEERQVFSSGSGKILASHLDRQKSSLTMLFLQERGTKISGSLN